MSSELYSPSDGNNMKIRKGLIKRIHVNKHVIAQNVKHGTHEPAITIQTSVGPVRAHRVSINGPSEMIYSDKPLSCGARVWLETTAEVDYEAAA